MTWPDVGCAWRGWAGGAALLAGGLLLAACHRGQPEGFSLRPLVEAGTYRLRVEVGRPAGADGREGLWFPSRPAEDKGPG